MICSNHVNYGHFSDLPVPFGVRAEATANNTSISVSWEWSPREGVLTCVDLVRVHYQPEGDSLMMYTMDNTAATNATLPNLQCNTKYTVWVHVESGSYMIGNTSAPRKVSLATKGKNVVYMTFHMIYYTLQHSVLIQPLPFLLMSLFKS